MKESLWIIDMLGKLELIAEKTSDLDTEEALRECIRELTDKLL